MQLSTNRKILGVGAAVLLIAFVVSVTPWYRAYIANDHRWTCAKLRKSIEWNYAYLLDTAADQYTAGSQEAVAAALHRANSRDEYVLAGSAQDGVAYEITGACREGGTFLVYIDDAGYLSVRCSLSEHDIDYTQLPEF